MYFNVIDEKDYDERVIESARMIGEEKDDEPRIVIVKLKYSNQKFEIFNHRDALRKKGKRVSNDLSFLQRQQIKKAKRCGLEAYFMDGKLVTFKPEENACKSRVCKRAVRYGDR
ncbi:hypothetical protein DPMN_076751 [Dreissena polymorpha]|uniref:Uncharacterized protein n=1 Tax=Dreissena polymorpha TaxID=45954 RepID=A0A9D3YNM8_DREPO|nr:hypothetical protein DPMN_076751 [Dreissena polymorpha]